MHIQELQKVAETIRRLPYCVGEVTSAEVESEQKRIVELAEEGKASAAHLVFRAALDVETESVAAERESAILRLVATAVVAYTTQAETDSLLAPVAAPQQAPQQAPRSALTQEARARFLAAAHIMNCHRQLMNSPSLSRHADFATTAVLAMALDSMNWFIRATEEKP